MVTSVVTAAPESDTFVEPETTKYCGSLFTVPCGCVYFAIHHVFALLIPTPPILIGPKTHGARQREAPSGQCEDPPPFRSSANSPRRANVRDLCTSAASQCLNTALSFARSVVRSSLTQCAPRRPARTFPPMRLLYQTAGFVLCHQSAGPQGGWGEASLLWSSVSSGPFVWGDCRFC